jgi:hypothetical protein
MYDSITSALIAGAPPLVGLDPARLREELTAAYVEIAAARLALDRTDVATPTDLTPILDRMGRLADAFEARIVLDLDRDRQRSIAFVAGAARNLIGQALRLRGAGATTTRLDEDAVGPEIAAALLFLISERSSDAAEAARGIHASDELVPIRRALILSISHLAQGRLSEVADLDVPDEPLVAHDTIGYAVDLLFRELLLGVILLARDSLGLLEEDGVSAAVSRFDRVGRLAVETHADSDPSNPTGLRAVSAFAGPHHLAGLLLRAAGTFRDSALVRTPAPGGTDYARWTMWLHGEAVRRPYLWENHRRAIGTGYLNRGQSMIMTSPTGSGKTTLSALKIAATIISGKSVVYIAPTHALVGQVERELTERVGQLAKAENVEDVNIMDTLPTLPPLAVMTPERCFSLLTFAPELFDNVGLLVFDEFHPLGVPSRGSIPTVSRPDRRGVDAMLCLLTFISVVPSADLLLLSAMVSNGPEVAAWLQSLTERPVHAFDDLWKPTRQLRCCVTYASTELRSAQVAANTMGGASRVAAVPLGLFSLISGWNPGAPEKLLLRPLTPKPVRLGQGRNSPRRDITANRYEVASEIADRFERTGFKTIIFCESIRSCVSTMNRLNRGRKAYLQKRDDEQEAWRAAAVSDLGDVSGLYDAGEQRAAVHHGDLLADERRLVESLFRSRDSGLNVLAATSTLAQGLNLPCDVVILAGTDRIDDSESGETTRSPLAAHEILNALGRAGRAGQSATGLAVVIPGQPIACDPSSRHIGHSNDLPVIFFEDDQCLKLIDPLTTLFDQIEVLGATTTEARYLLRRVAASLSANADAAAFNELARRTFGFFQRFRANAGVAEEWLTQRRTALVKAIQAAAEPPTLPWEEELAAMTGATARFIAALAKAYDGAPRDSVDAEPWSDWLLDQFDPAYDDADAFLRPDTMARVFGRAYTNQPDDVTKRRVALAGVRTMLHFWLSGAPLLRLEAEIVHFIVAHERGVQRPSIEDPKAKHARRFALRLAPDLGFLFGILAQVAAKRDEDDRKVSPPMLQFLPQLVRRGYATPYHFALSLDAPRASRVEIHRTYLGLAGRLQRSASDEWSTVQDKLRNAQGILLI